MEWNERKMTNYQKDFLPYVYKVKQKARKTHTGRQAGRQGKEGKEREKEEGGDKL